MIDLTLRERKLAVGLMLSRLIWVGRTNDLASMNLIFSFQPLWRGSLLYRYSNHFISLRDTPWLGTESRLED